VIADPARQVLEASTSWWELVTTIAGFVTAFLTVVAAVFSSWYFFQNRRIADGSLHHVAQAKRRRDVLETAAIVATATAAAAGLIAGSSALLYFSRNRLLQTIQQREFAAVAETASQALKQQVELKRENAALNGKVVDLQGEQLRLSSETASAYGELYAAKAKIADLERAQKARTISRTEATRMRAILSPYATGNLNVKRRIIFTANVDNVETQDFAKQLLEVFLNAGWDARLTPPVLEFSSAGIRSLEGLTLELRDQADTSGSWLLSRRRSRSSIRERARTTTPLAIQTSSPLESPQREWDEFPANDLEAARS